MQTIAVVDYGMGNLRSVVNALEAVCTAQQRVVLTSDPQQLGEADRVVFPGQGAARDCMRAIDEHGLRDTIVTGRQQPPLSRHLHGYAGADRFQRGKPGY